MKTPWTLVIGVGSLLAVSGAVVTVSYLFQPWRSCPYDDSPAACAMLPEDARVMGIAMFVGLIGAATTALAVVARRRFTTTDQPERKQRMRESSVVLVVLGVVFLLASVVLGPMML